MFDSQVLVVHLSVEKQHADARQYRCMRSSDTGVMVLQLADAAAAELEVMTSILQHSHTMYSKAIQSFTKSF